MTTTITKATAKKVLAALHEYLNNVYADDTYGPKLVEKWDWLGAGEDNVADWSIVWEEGPYEWALLFPYGGRDHEFGVRYKDVSAKLDEMNVHVEAVTGWATSIYVN